MENVSDTCQGDEMKHLKCNKHLLLRLDSTDTPVMPWFGMDIGGTLVKLVYFEPNQDFHTRTYNDEEELRSSANIHRYLIGNKAYGQSGRRDVHLQMDNLNIRARKGSIHFIRFPTSQMNSFIKLAKDKGMAKLASTVCATGGGAYKFEHDFRREVKMSLNKFDEIDSCLNGLEFIAENNPNNEMFYYKTPEDEENGCIKTPYDTSKEMYPFMLVNIGSGVSILHVKGPDDYKRVYGTSLGGGTFFGLCCLLTNCSTFEEALELAAQGDNKKVDKLVKDIYGGDYDRFHLSGDTGKPLIFIEATVFVWGYTQLNIGVRGIIHLIRYDFIISVASGVINLEPFTTLIQVVTFGGRCCRLFGKFWYEGNADCIYL